jgi:hypothetical protein
MVSLNSRNICAHLILRCTGALHFGFDAPARPVGFNDARMDAVHMHAVGLAAIGEAFREGGDRRIDRAADREIGSRFTAAGAADRDQRTAPLLQQRPGGAGEPHMGEEFQRVTVFPIGVGEGEKIAALDGARVVDENVECAEIALDLLNEFSGRVLLAQVDDGVTGAASHLTIAAAVSSSAPLSRPVSITSQPSAASARAMPRPMPRLDPVTSAILSLSPRSM